MTEYVVTLANHKPEVERIEADEVSYDAHWVAFKVKEGQEPPAPVHCESCGEPTGVRRARSAPRSAVVAIFPTNQVRRVVSGRIGAEDE